MLGGENLINFFQTPLVENPYQMDLNLNAPFQSKRLDTEFKTNSSRWFYQQQSDSQEAATDDLCSLSLRHGSNWLDCSLKLGLLNCDRYPNPAGVSTSLSLCLPEDRHERHTGTASTSQEIFSVYNDLRAEITRQEEDVNMFIQQQSYQSQIYRCLAQRIIQKCMEQEAEMYRELRKIREQQATSLANSIGRLCEQKIIQKNLELEEMFMKNRELMEKVNEATAEAGHWQFQAWQSQTALSTLQTEFERAREECGESDAASYVAGRVEGDMATRCRICKIMEARILHLPCRHLSVCGKCDQSTNLCPICFSPKTQSIEVFIP